PSARRARPPPAPQPAPRPVGLQGERHRGRPVERAPAGRRRPVPAAAGSLAVARLPARRRAAGGGRVARPAGAVGSPARGARPVPLPERRSIAGRHAPPTAGARRRRAGAPARHDHLTPARAPPRRVAGQARRLAGPCTPEGPATMATAAHVSAGTATPTTGPLRRNRRLDPLPRWRSLARALASPSAPVAPPLCARGPPASPPTPGPPAAFNPRPLWEDA